MNTNRTLTCTLAISILLAGAAAFAAETGAAETESSSTNVVEEIFGGGKVDINIRARYEGVDQSNDRDANALTIRTRLGFTTKAYNGFKGRFQVTNTTALDGDAYNQAGLNPGGADRAVVADPEGTDLNQAWLGYTWKATDFLLGRQRIVLDNARFVGDVGWRQNQQTFNALYIKDTTFDGWSLHYGYLSQINRVLGEGHPAGTWDSQSHILNASYDGFSIGKLTGYGYLLEFDNAAVNSTSTFGLRLAGTHPVGSVKLSYKAEFASQSDYQNSPLDYSANYYLADLGVVMDWGTVGAGYEVLGSGDGVGFKTPLATLHAFNGWADQFLVTPSDGLKDLYIKVKASLPWELSFLGVYHDFDADTGEKYGSEIDLAISRKFGDTLKGLIKFADFSSDRDSRPSVTKLWAQVEFAY